MLYPATRPAPKPVPAIPTEPIFPVRSETLDSYAGDWELQPGLVVTVTRHGRILNGRLGNQSFVLRPVSETKFKVDGPGVDLEFIKGEGGKVNKMNWSQGEQSNVAVRVKPFRPDADELMNYSGEFFSEELSASYFVKVKNGKLVAEHSRHPDINFWPAKKDQFIGDAWYFGRTDFVRDTKGKIVGMKVSSGRVRNLVFTRVEK